MLTKTDPLADQSQKQLYKHLLDMGETPLYALRDKLNPPARRIGKENALVLAKMIHSATYQLPANLPSPLRFHSFRLAHNALPTRARDQWRHTGESIQCPLCGSTPETLAHLHSCNAATFAISIISNNTPNKASVFILQNATPDDYIFRSSCNDADRLTLLLLSRAIWRTRVDFAAKPFAPSFDKAAHQIAAIFKELRRATTYKPKKLDRSRKVREFQALFSLLPPSTLVYTDGSSLGNPGPALRPSTTPSP